MRIYYSIRKQVSWQIEGELLSQHYTYGGGSRLSLNSHLYYRYCIIILNLQIK